MNESREQLALRIVDLARAEILAQHPFLAPAVGKMPFATGSFACPFATDGTVLGMDAGLVLQAFGDEGQTPVHDLLHTVLHCVLLHPFSASGRDARLWDLACDISVECLVAQLVGQRGGQRGNAITQALGQVQTRFTGAISAQRLYRALVRGTWEVDVDEWFALFVCDDHLPWRERVLVEQAPPVGEAGFDENADPNGSTDAADAESGESVGREVELEEDDELREEWKRIARQLKVEALALQRERGKNAGTLVETVDAVLQDRVDYASWLRQFAAMGEHPGLSDQDYDPVFYTFGLQRYGNMPLIEPVEQREERRVREFVIVIDTSQSVSGEAVKRFVSATCSILKSTESFARRVHVRIIQCDAKVQADDVLTSIDDLDAWASSLELRGFGGTDFRPAFEYVDGLVEQGAFEDLGGLVYFTDGWGIYPERRPDYKVAFAFYDDDHRASDVPPWAMQLVLDDDDIYV